MWSSVMRVEDSFHQVRNGATWRHTNGTDHEIDYMLTDASKGIRCTTISTASKHFTHHRLKANTVVFKSGCRGSKRETAVMEEEEDK